MSRFSTSGKRALVTGAGGFIGHHLVTRLKAEGFWVRGADLKYPEYAPSDADEFHTVDLRNVEECRMVTAGVDGALRAEDLDLAQFCALARAYRNLRSG